MEIPQNAYRLVFSVRVDSELVDEDETRNILYNSLSDLFPLIEENCIYVDIQPAQGRFERIITIYPEGGLLESEGYIKDNENAFFIFNSEFEFDEGFETYSTVPEIMQLISECLSGNFTVNMQPIEYDVDDEDILAGRLRLLLEDDEWCEENDISEEDIDLFYAMID